MDGASLAAFTPLKDSQTYIRGATDRPELSPSKAGLHRELGARFANYSDSSTLLPLCAACAKQTAFLASPALLLDRPTLKTQAKLHRRDESIIQ